MLPPQDHRVDGVGGGGRQPPRHELIGRVPQPQLPLRVGPHDVPLAAGPERGVRVPEHHRGHRRAVGGLQEPRRGLAGQVAEPELALAVGAEDVAPPPREERGVRPAERHRRDRLPAGGAQRLRRRQGRGGGADAALPLVVAAHDIPLGPGQEGRVRGPGHEGRDGRAVGRAHQLRDVRGLPVPEAELAVGVHAGGVALAAREKRGVLPTQRHSVDGLPVGAQQRQRGRRGLPQRQRPQLPLGPAAQHVPPPRRARGRVAAPQDDRVHRREAGRRERHRDGLVRGDARAGLAVAGGPRGVRVRGGGARARHHPRAVAAADRRDGAGVARAAGDGARAAEGVLAVAHDVRVGARQRAAVDGDLEDVHRKGRGKAENLQEAAFVLDREERAAQRRRSAAGGPDLDAPHGGAVARAPAQRVQPRVRRVEVGAEEHLRPVAVVRPDVADAQRRRGGVGEPGEPDAVLLERRRHCEGDIAAPAGDLGGRHEQHAVEGDGEGAALPPVPMAVLRNEGVVRGGEADGGRVLRVGGQGAGRHSGAGAGLQDVPADLVAVAARGDVDGDDPAPGDAHGLEVVARVAILLPADVAPLEGRAGRHREGGREGGNCVVLVWIGLDWMGLDGIAWDWMGLSCVGLDSVRVNGIEWGYINMHWSKFDLI